MSRTALVAVAAVLCVAAARGDEPLTIGSPAPKFEPVAFVRGEPVKGLTKGTVYVVEFSGTQCAPCLKCIPDLTALQKKYKDVVLVSVYSGEPEDAVRAYVAKHGDKIGFRVAIDPTGAVDEAWTGAASAWASRTCSSLVRTVASHGSGPVGDGRTAGPDRRRHVRPAARRHPAQARTAGRAVIPPHPSIEKKGLEAYNRINDQIKAGKSADALAATEAALRSTPTPPRGFTGSARRRCTSGRACPARRPPRTSWPRNSRSRRS